MPDPLDQLWDTSYELYQTYERLPDPSWNDGEGFIEAEKAEPSPSRLRRARLRWLWSWMTRVGRRQTRNSDDRDGRS